MQPGPLGGQGAPVQATNQAQPDQAQPDQGGVPSDEDDDDRAQEAVPTDVAMPDQAPDDLAAGGPPANFGQGESLLSLCHPISTMLKCCIVARSEVLAMQGLRFGIRERCTEAGI